MESGQEPKSKSAFSFSPHSQSKSYNTPEHYASLGCESNLLGLKELLYCEVDDIRWLRGYLIPGLLYVGFDPFKISYMEGYVEGFFGEGHIIQKQ